MNFRLEMDVELAKKKAHEYAGKHGAVSPEAAYVHRFNGYFHGYVERSGELSTLQEMDTVPPPVPDDSDLL
jgi:hypothetical protein